MTAQPAAGQGTAQPAAGQGTAQPAAGQGTAQPAAGQGTAQPAAGQVRRSRGTLADGREILYFDDSGPHSTGQAERLVPDTRDLPPAEGGSTLRYDVLTGEWVAIASHRNQRTFLPPADECPLCPTGRSRTPTEIPASDYDVVVFENRFPSLTSRAQPVGSLVDDEPLWPQRPGVGRCEVVCFTSDHSASFTTLSGHRVRTVVEAWADRTRELSQAEGVAQVFIFENRGQEIGVTLHHPHGQIYAYPFVTPRTSVLLRQAATYRERTDGNLLRDVLDAERRAGTRVVLSGERWTAYVPAAARWPVEVHLAPHRDVPDLAALDDAERDELAVVYLELLRRADRYYDGVPALPYVAGWHQAPIGAARPLGRLHLQLFSVLRAPGKLKYLAGSESGMGAWINDVSPERIAARLREVAP
jgi:UDPglucose--hexose-1-phosphate uridylyltransferase